MRLFVRVGVAAGILVVGAAIVPGCSGGSGGGGGSDGGGSDAGPSCASVCAAKAAACHVSSTLATADCASLCAAHPTPSELACAMSSTCSALLTAFENGRAPCVDASAPMEVMDASHDVILMDVQVQDGRPGDAGHDATTHDDAGHDATTHDDASADADRDAKRDSGDDAKRDADDAAKHDAGIDASDASQPPPCTVTLSGAASGTYGCTALASYTPSQGVLFTLMADGSGVFQLGAVLSPTNNFTAGAMYASGLSEATGFHRDGEGVWDYSSDTGDGTASVSVTSMGTPRTDDAGDGDIYFSLAYGTAIIDLVAKDPPFAMGDVLATVNWTTNQVGPVGDAGPPDAGADGSRDGASDSSQDGPSDASDSGVDGGACVVALSGGLTGSYPCTTSASYIESMLTSLTIQATGDGGATTTIAIDFPGDFASLNGGRTSASLCSPSADCSVGVSTSSGAGSWSRSWATSDEGSVTPWFDLSITGNGVCTPTITPEIDTCSDYGGTFTATIPAVAGGGAPVTLTVTGL